MTNVCLCRAITASLTDLVKKELEKKLNLLQNLLTSKRVPLTTLTNVPSTPTRPAIPLLAPLSHLRRFLATFLPFVRLGPDYSLADPEHIIGLLRHEVVLATYQLIAFQTSPLPLGLRTTSSESSDDVTHRLTRRVIETSRWLEEFTAYQAGITLQQEVLRLNQECAQDCNQKMQRELLERLALLGEDLQQIDSLHLEGDSLFAQVEQLRSDEEAVLAAARMIAKEREHLETVLENTR